VKLSMKVPDTHLVTVFNALPESFSLRLPLVGTTAFAVDLSAGDAQVTMSTNGREYDQRRRELADGLNAKMKLHREFPDFDKLRETLIMSGVAALSDETEQNLRDLFAQLETPSPGGFELNRENHYYIGFDTNCLYKRLLSTHIFPRLAAVRGARPWDLAISEHTVKEIRRGASKLGEAQTAELESAAGQWVHSVLRNQPRLADRGRRIGMVQYRRALHDHNAMRVPAVVSDADLKREMNAAASEYRGDDKAQGDARSAVVDECIAQSYSQFAVQTGGRRVVFLTFDRDCAGTCAGYDGLITITLSTPDMARLKFPLACRWESVAELVAVLARIYGRVELISEAGEALCKVDGYWFGSGREPIEQDDLEAGNLWLEARPTSLFGEREVAGLDRSLRILHDLEQSEEWRRGNVR